MTQLSASPGAPHHGHSLPLVLRPNGNVGGPARPGLGSPVLLLFCGLGRGTFPLGLSGGCCCDRLSQRPSQPCLRSLLRPHKGGRWAQSCFPFCVASTRLQLLTAAIWLRMMLLLGPQQTQAACSPLPVREAGHVCALRSWRGAPPPRGDLDRAPPLPGEGWEKQLFRLPGCPAP